MTTDDLLHIIEDRGLTVVWRDDATPVLRGDRAAANAPLLAVLPFHREEILRRIGPPPAPALPAPPAPPPAPARLSSLDPCPRRVVLLAPNGSVAEALADAPVRGTPGFLRDLAGRRPGVPLAAQWLDRRRDPPEWTTFLRIVWPVEDPPCPALSQTTSVTPSGSPPTSPPPAPSASGPPTSS